MYFMLRLLTQTSQQISATFTLRRKATPVSMSALEPEFRTSLDGMADDIGISTNALICRIDAARKHANLSSAIRLYVLRKATAASTVAPKERQTMEEVRAT
jgi:predicted DNA-binding ribbon-helix-helix protein